MKQLPIIMHFKLLAEYHDVLTRPKMRSDLIDTSEEIEKILIGVVSVSEEVNPHFL